MDNNYGEKQLKFKRRMSNRIRAIREEMTLTQQKLAKKVDVSRQTIYYIEKNAYNPSLEIIRKLMKVLDKKFEELFYEEPVVKDLIENLSVKDAKEIADNVGISYEMLISLSEITDKELTKNFNEEILKKIASELKTEFENLFEID